MGLVVCRSVGWAVGQSVCLVRPLAGGLVRRCVLWSVIPLVRWSVRGFSIDFRGGCCAVFLLRRRSRTRPRDSVGMFVSHFVVSSTRDFSFGGAAVRV